MNFTNQYFTVKYHDSSEVLEEFYRRQKWSPLNFKLPVDETCYTNENYLIRSTLKSIYLPICDFQCKNENELESPRHLQSRKPAEQNYKSNQKKASIESKSSNKVKVIWPQGLLNSSVTKVGDLLVNSEDIKDKQDNNNNKERFNSNVVVKKTDAPSDEDSNVVVDGIIEYHDLNCDQLISTEHITLHNPGLAGSQSKTLVTSHYSPEEVNEIDSILDDLQQEKEDLTVNIFYINNTYEKSIQNRLLPEETLEINRKIVNTNYGSKNHLNLKPYYSQCNVNDVHQNIKNSDPQMIGRSSCEEKLQSTEPSKINLLSHNRKPNPFSPEKTMVSNLPTQKEILNPCLSINSSISTNTYQYEPFLGSLSSERLSEHNQQNKINFVPVIYSLGEELKHSLEIINGNECTTDIKTNETLESKNPVNTPSSKEYLYLESSFFPSTAETSAILQELCNLDDRTSQSMVEEMSGSGHLLIPTNKFQFGGTSEVPYQLNHPENQKPIRPIEQYQIPKLHKIVTRKVYPQALLDSAKEIYIQRQRQKFLSKNRNVNYPLSALKKNLEQAWERISVREKEFYIEEVNRSSKIETQPQLDSLRQHPGFLGLNKLCAQPFTTYSTPAIRKNHTRCQSKKRSFSLSPQTSVKKKSQSRARAEKQTYRSPVPQVPNLLQKVK